LRILITNNTLANRAGTELYVRDLAIGLRERGHEPIAYSTRLGEVAREIRAAGVGVIDDLNCIAEPPEIIHGHHHLDTMAALLHFPTTPAIFVCHGSRPWEEAAPLFPRILRYVAVDHACRDRLLLEHAIRPDRVEVILNFVDLERFKPRTGLPARPRRALIFSNLADERTHLPALRTACKRAGILVDVVGLNAGKVCAQPESILGNYDVVFAKGRAALEGLAVGTAVVLCDATGAGPMVSMKNVEYLRLLNFGLRALKETPGSEVILRALDQYDPLDAANVCSFIRAGAGRNEAVEKFLSLYEDVINENGRLRNTEAKDEYGAVAAYLQELRPRLQTVELLTAKADRLDRIMNSPSWQLISRCIGIRRRFLDVVSLLSNRRSRPKTNRADNTARAETSCNEAD
jgi:hypothetical protein